MALWGLPEKGAVMKNRIPDGHWLLDRPIAHRGLHCKEIPENGLAAFEKAVLKGYPIETDVQVTKDGVPVIFHDDNVKRMTGVDKNIGDLTLGEVKELSLGRTDEKIPTFEEFLNFLDGRVPVVIEYKTQKDKDLIVEKTLPLLDAYKGEFVVQSFDPLIVGRFAKIRPEIIRGQLICKDRHKNLKFVTDKLLAHGVLNFISKPDFINMNVEYLPVSKVIKYGRRVICWTIKNEDDLARADKYADNYIFENIRPQF